MGGLLVVYKHKLIMVPSNYNNIAVLECVGVDWYAAMEIHVGSLGDLHDCKCGI